MISDALSLVRADLLKLTRRRGLMALAGAIVIGGVVVMYTVLAIRHGSDPVQNGPAGGIRHFDDSTDFIAHLGVVVAATIGATAGAGDAEAGVLRDLVGTGRSRSALYASRAAAGLGLTLAVLVTAVALSGACSVALAGSLPAPSLSHIFQRGAAVLAFGAMSALLAVGISTFAKSRGPVIAVVVASQLIVSQILLQVTFLGDLRALLPLEAFRRMAGDATPGIHTSIAAAVAVTAVWALAAVRAGGWWARRVEV